MKPVKPDTCAFRLPGNPTFIILRNSAKPYRLGERDPWLAKVPPIKELFSFFNSISSEILFIFDIQLLFLGAFRIRHVFIVYVYSQ